MHNPGEGRGEGALDEARAAQNFAAYLFCWADYPTAIAKSFLSADDADEHRSVLTDLYLTAYYTDITDQKTQMIIRVIRAIRG